MAHNTRVRANIAAWTATPSVLPSEFDQLDQNAFVGINGDGGGTYAPAALITIGGLGLTVSGPFAASNVNGTFEVTGTGTIQIDNGGQIFVATGGFATFNTGSSLFLGGTTTVTNGGGGINMAANVDYNFSPTRTVTKRGIILLATTYAGADGSSLSSTPTNADAWISGGYGGTLTTALATVVSGRNTILALPGAEKMFGATLVSVAIKNQGLDANTPTTYATFGVFRTDSSGTSVPLRAAGPVTDHHSTPTTWLNNPDTTTFTCDQFNTSMDPGTYRYTITCVHPCNSGSGTHMQILDVAATYSVPKLAP